MLAAVVAMPAGARADESDESTEAEELFGQAKQLMAAGRYAEACVKFAESHKLDPATGGTLLNLANCHDKLGKLASAWSEYKEALRFAQRFHRTDRERFALDRIAQIEPRLSKLTIVPPRGGSDVSVVLDGVAVDPGALHGIAVDPGDHSVEVRAPGKQPWTARTTFEAAEREEREIDVPPLVDAAPPPAAPVPPVPEQRNEVPWRTVGFVTGGVGAALFVTGTIFGALAIVKNNDSKTDCTPACTQQGADESRQALVFANLANVGVALGVLAMAGGTFLVLRPPGTPLHVGLAPAISPSAHALGAGATGATLAAQGSW